MRILVLGGPAFLGRTFVESAVARGHVVTLFNRGKRNPDLFPELDTIHSDRTSDVSALEKGGWDAVFDACGYFPRAVKMSAEAAKPWAERYLYISSISVFKNLSVLSQAEDVELATLEDPTTEEITGETYGGLKVLCEQTVLDTLQERAIVVRPGLIVGPLDYTDRFTYWPVRMAKGGDVLVPAIKNQPVQVIDVRDLADWCVTLLEQGSSGVFNATGPQEPYSMEQFLTATAEGTEANLVWVSSEFLTKNGVHPWSDLPLALDYEGTSNGMLHVDVSKAIHAGLKFRSFAETVRETRAWALSRPADYQLKAGLTSERESELLKLWRTHDGPSLPQ
jgi:2'-hydroxyisoflavone reductase